MSRTHGKAGSAHAGRSQPNAGGGGAHRAEHHKGAVNKSIDFARKAIVKAVRLVAKNADKTVFPLSLLVIVALFLLIQGRIDRNDPKLAMAPLVADTQVEFGPAVRLSGLEVRAARADTRPSFGNTRETE